MAAKAAHEPARIWVALFLEAEGWDYPGTAYYDLNIHGAMPLLQAHPESAEVFRAWFRDNAMPEGDRAYYINQLRERLDQS